MESDFRTGLYRGYVSTFKGANLGNASVWWDHKYLPLLDDLPRDAEVLEVGCGSGGVLAYLGDRGFSRAQGIDVSAEQVALAQERGVRAKLADALEYLPAHTASFDVVIAIDVLEHFSRDELPKLVDLFSTALRPRGRLIIQTANGAGLFARQVIYGDLTHLTIFTPESLGQLLRMVGFVDLTFYETGPIPVRLRGRLNVTLWTAIKGIANQVRSIETGKLQSVWTENFICRAFKPAPPSP